MAPSHFKIDVDLEDDKFSTLGTRDFDPIHHKSHIKPSSVHTTQVGKDSRDHDTWKVGGTKYTVPKRGEHWEKCYKKVRDYDDDLCDGWRDEVDKLLVFAGLFSAAVTAFVAESYQRLSEDPADKNTWLLEQILLEVHNSNIGNISSSPLPTPPVFSPSPMDIRLNVFWFMSLSLSLATVLIGILCIQWLREYQRKSPLDPQDAIALRQMRYEGLKAWMVPHILMCLPVLFHISIILFFVGVLDLLWNLNYVVASLVSVISVVVLAFIAATTFLPAAQLFFLNKNTLRMPQCAYKSPQAWAVHQAVIPLVRLMYHTKSVFKKKSFRLSRYKKFFKNKGWVDFDISWSNMRKRGPAATDDTVNGIVWTDEHLGPSIDMISVVYHCIRDLEPRAGAQIVSQINDSSGAHLNTPEMQQCIDSMLRKQEQDQYGELVSALYLEDKCGSFPQLELHQLESVVRFLNTRRDSLDDETQVVDCLPFVRWPLDYIKGKPGDVVAQFLLCVKNLVTEGQLAEKYTEDVWRLLHLILSTPAASHDSRGSRHPNLAQLACDIMFAFQARLPDTVAKDVEDERKRISYIDDPELQEIKNCTSKIIRSFPSQNLADLKPYARPVLQAIDVRMKAGDGLNSALSRDVVTHWEEIVAVIGLDDNRLEEEDNGEALSG